MINRPGIWIPAEVWNDHRISLIGKILLSEILNFGERGSSFFKSNDQIAEEMNVSISSIQRAIRDLLDLGLIEKPTFDGRRRHLIPTLQIDQADRSNRPSRMVKMKGQDDQNDSAGMSNRHVPIKRKKKEKKDEEKRKEIHFPFPEFEEIWEEWKSYKKEEHRFSFKSERSELTSLKQLQDLSKNDREIAIKIIGRSIANGWKGFFALPEGKGAQDAPSEKDRDLFAKFIQTGEI